jgi:hypothetical protein
MARTSEDIRKLLQEVDEATLRSKRTLTQAEQTLITTHRVITALSCLENKTYESLRNLREARARVERNWPLRPPLKDES